MQRFRRLLGVGHWDLVDILLIIATWHRMTKVCPIYSLSTCTTSRFTDPSPILHLTKFPARLLRPLPPQSNPQVIISGMTKRPMCTYNYGDRDAVDALVGQRIAYGDWHEWRIDLETPTWSLQATVVEWRLDCL
jgi:hypothetical protein